MLGGASSGHAESLLFDGDFESGTLIGWVPGIQGTAILAAKGRCFSSQDTSALSIRGKYAGLLRGSDQLEPGIAATMTSKPFTAGKGFLFLALTEQYDGEGSISMPYALMVSVLDSKDVILSRHALDTARVALSSGCPSMPRDQRFSEHFISTQKYLGQAIKLRFSQHPVLAQSGNFSLIDQVSIVQQGEIAAYSKKPVAVAAIEYEAKHDFLYLVAKIPQHALEESRNWTFNWHIDSERGGRASSKVCINNLKSGNYTANLSVKGSAVLSTDTLHFYVPHRPQSTEVDSNWTVCETAVMLESQHMPVHLVSTKPGLLP